MNKNLKKVISSVAAFTMVASSVAALAVDFPDVESTASYAQAVKELSALNVISGYEDGTFGPEKLVTRAEITKMIVDALKEGGSAESAKGTNTKFADVTGEHWASGYITQGVSNGFIAGMSDIEFSPDSNVTYVQAQKMLVCAIGYDTYATAQGGWPSGYKTYASTLEITKGISGLTDSTELTRAQVAQMIDNAMGAPLCVIDSWKTEWNGSRTPVLTVKDGTGKDYQTLFTKKHNVYKVYGRVAETSKTGNIESDQVLFTIEKADNFDDDYIVASNPEDKEMYIGDSNADQYIKTYAQALVQKDDDDEYTILSLAVAAANKSVTVAAEDIDDGKTDLAENRLYFYPAGTTKNSVKYELSDSAVYYVNGVEMGTFDEDAYTNYILKNDTAAVTLQKETKTGSTSSESKYSVIMISTYEVAVVDEVNEKTTQTTIAFKEVSNNIRKTSLKVEKDDDTKTYTFTLNGEAIEPEDLQEHDVLNISYDKSADSFADSDFYDVIVSRDIVEGVRCTGATADNTEFTIGGVKYKVATGMNNIVPEPSVTYNLYLDHFGRIAAFDEDSSTKKLGVLKNVYQKANLDWVAEVITKEGSLEEYKVDKNNGATYKAILQETGENTDKYPLQVIDYKVNSSTNKITINKAKKSSGNEYTQNELKATAEYKESSNKIGGIRISDATTILDLSDVNTKDEYRVVSELKDGTEYTAYGYDKSSSDSSYRFVIITDGISGFTSETQLAVFDGKEIVTDGDDDRTAYNLVVNNEEIQVMLDDDVDYIVGDDDFVEFEEGDLILYTTNTAGYVTKVASVFADTNVLRDQSRYSSFKEYAFDNYASVLDKASLQLDDENISDLLSDSNDDVEIVFGPVLDRHVNDVTIGSIVVDGDDYLSHLSDNATTATLDSESKIYVYDYSINSSKASRVVLESSIQVTSIPNAAHVNGDVNNDGIVLSHEDIDAVVFAVARIVNDDIKEIYLIVEED